MKTYSLQYWNSHKKAWWSLNDLYTSITDWEQVLEIQLEAWHYHKVKGATRFRIIETISRPIKGFKLEKPE